MKRKFNGFTLIELLVVISIIGILMALSILGLQGARSASRDAARKADLEKIRSGIEIYKSDCGTYPLSADLDSGSDLMGSGSSTSCALDNTYISGVPGDPLDPARSYYYSSDGVTYELCAALENTPASPGACSGSCTEVCNYKTVSP